MADLTHLLAVLEHDPDDAHAVAAVAAAAHQAPPEVRTSRLAKTRAALAQRSRPDVVLNLIDIELSTLSTHDLERKVDLLVEKGMLLEAELLDVAGARAAFEQVIGLRPDDVTAKDALSDLDVAAANWQKFADKYLREAAASTDRNLATGLYVSAAETFVRFAPSAPDAETHLRKALEIDPRNAKAAFHLARLLRRAQRWRELAQLLDQRAELAATLEEKLSALLANAELARTHLDDATHAEQTLRRVLQLEPAQPQALRSVTDALATKQDWHGIVAVYQAALKAKRDGDDPGMLLQIGMVLWKHVGDLDRAEDYFRRLRKYEPAHPAAIDFYRVYYPAKGDNAKLLALLRQVEKSPRTRGDSARPLTVEIAELAEAQNNLEKAIEAWKQVLRSDPTVATNELGARARASLARLYRQSEKWNALIDLMKEDIDRMPGDDVGGRVTKLHELVDIYREQKLDTMVINTYNTILKLDPENGRATDELAAKFRTLGRWNDLIVVLTRKSEGKSVPPGERVVLLREIADLWSERFGNFANAIKPLERILELSPGDATAVGRLKEIYLKRRQWRALIDVLGREASVLGGQPRRVKQSEMARLAAERLGDTRLAIEILNRILVESGPDHGETLAALAALYEREKRWLALAEIVERQAAAASSAATPSAAIAFYERLGQIYADRLQAPQLAAAAWQQVLAIEPGHAKALRTLRELYANAGDFAGLEQLYARLGQEDELIDALLAIADRVDAKPQRLALVERAAQLAHQRAASSDGTPTAAAAADSGKTAKRTRATSHNEATAPLDRARQIWERVLAIEPAHVGAATALAPIYSKQEKWAKLITVLEIELAAAPDNAARLAKIDEIRSLCEHKLTSRTLAFTWTLRALELAPHNGNLLADVLRLASEPEQWREVTASLERHAGNVELPLAKRLELYRELARIATRRLADPERARGYHRNVIALAPDDREAEQALEELAIQLADWPELLASYRRRAAREKDATERGSLLIEIASLQEEKLVDLDGAAASYREALAVLPGQLRALRSLARIEEARGDSEALAAVLAEELVHIPDGQARFDQLMRLGVLAEQLEHPTKAVGYFRDALAIPLPGGGVRPTAVAAVTRLVLAGSGLDSGLRVDAARSIAGHLESGRQVSELARVLEIIRAAEPPSERLDLDRRLMRLYHTDLGDPAAAWTTGLRVLAADPSDRDNRKALAALAGQLGRDGEWAQQLGAAVTALRATNQRSELRAVATELALVAQQRLDDRATAERSWLAVLDIELDAGDAFEALASLYKRDQRWSDLRGLLERRIEVTLDDQARLGCLLELAALEETVLDEPANAIAAHQRVLAIEPGHPGSHSALDRLYTQGEKWRELEQLLAQRSDYVSDGALAELAFRRAELFATRLGDPGRAVDFAEDVLARDRDHAGARRLLEQLVAQSTGDTTLRVARLLEPLYEQEKRWRELVGTLRIQRKLIEPPAGLRKGGQATESVELLSRIAAIEEAELANPGEALSAWVEVIGLDATHERARNEIVRLAGALQRWPEAAAALERAASAAPPSDVASRSALLGELATYYDAQLGDQTRAIDAQRRLLECDPTNPIVVRRAGGALARLYQEAGNWRDLRAIMRRQAEWAEQPEDKRALLARVAAIEEDKLADREAAIATWRDVLADHPTDPSALNALARLFESSERWRELVEILRRKLEAAATTGQAPEQLLARIAEIHEVMLEEPDEAIAAHLETIDRDPANRRALSELARLYREHQRHADLLEVLEREAQLDPAIRGQLQLEIARLLAGPLGRPIEALERWQAVLAEEPHHPQAIAAIDATLNDPELRATAADMLRPVYASSGQYDRLAALVARVAEWTDDVPGKLAALGEVVRLREHQLGDKPGAFTAQLTALRVAATEPELPHVVAETERLASELDREGDLIDAYREVAPNVLDAEIQRRLYLDVADLARAVRHDIPLAREYYQKVLDGQPDDRRALAALESIYRDSNDNERLVEVLLRQAEVGGPGDERVGALVEAAGLYAELGRPDDAIATWEQVLQVAPERRDAVDALERLYRAQGRWPDVVDLYDRRLGFATSIEEAVALRVQLGDIYERELRDFETAIDNYSAALGGDPRNPAALAAVERYLVDPDLRVVAADTLEPIYVAHQRWPDLIRVYEARLESAADPRERIKLTRFVARLYEEQLEDFESASRWYARVFREAPSDPASRDQLQRLASMIDNWGFVADAYQQYLDDQSGDSPELREIAIAAATIYDRRINDTDRAYAAYRRALAIDAGDAFPDERELIRRLEELCGRAAKPADLVAIYDEVAARAEDDLRREVLVKRARLLERGLADSERAIEGWREVVEQAHSAGDTTSYREAVGELERLYRAAGKWRDLVDLYESRIAREDHVVQRGQLRLALADVHEREVHDLAAAIDQYEQVINDGPGWETAIAALERLVVESAHRERITELLEPVYREQDWWQKLVVILDAKLDYITDPTRQISTLHEIAQIHEERGGALDLAVSALSRAWRIDVAEDDSLTKLLSLAGKLEAWDDAVTTLEGGAASAPNPDMAAGLWARAAEIHEVQRNDLPRAIAAWRKVEEVRSDDIVALTALDRLLAVEGRVSDLVQVVQRRAELTEDVSVRLVLLHRAAALYDDVLRDRARAIAAYKAVLGVDDTDGSALDALERLYREAGEWRELVATLERKIELADHVAARHPLRRAAAKIYEENLSDIYQAIGQLTAILDDDAGDQAALAELDRIYGREKLWPELLDVVDRRALLAITSRERADLAYRAARLVEVELADPEAAIPRYGAVLGVMATHAEGRAALEALMAADANVEATTAILERVYRNDRDSGGLVRVYERRLAAPGGGQPSDYAALAEVHETLASDPASAFAVWSRAIAASPDDSELLVPLLRLAASQRLWPELATRLDQLLQDPLPPDVEQTYAMRLGEIAEDQLSPPNLEAAAQAYERAAGGPEPRAALAALARVLARANRWPDLAVVLRRQADAAEDSAHAAEHLYRLGDLSETTLRDSNAAIAAYREVLAGTPTHPGARAALERMMATASRSEREEIVETLEPLFEQDDDQVRLASVLEAKLSATDDRLDAAAVLQRLAEIYEHRLTDRARALDAVLRWLAVDASSAQALNETDRLAERLGQWPEVGARVAAIAHAPDADRRDPETQVLLLTFLGRIQRKRLGQLDAAAASYRAALALEPDSAMALEDLIKILRQQGDERGLAELIRRRARSLPDLAGKRAAFAEVAAISERAGDVAGAVSAWREYLDADDSDRAALLELARLHRSELASRSEARSDLIDALERAARLSPNAADEKPLRIEIAQLEEGTPRAVSAWQAVIDLDGDDLAAMAALEKAYVRAGDWMAVTDLQTRRLGLARSSWDKVAIHSEIARLAEEKRGSADDAISAWFAALDIDSSHLPAYDNLERLLAASKRWHDLVELLERRGELHATQGDTAGELAALARAADVWERELDNPDAAGEIIEKILAREPGSVAALTRLSKIYERGGDWDKCKATLEQALKLSPTGRDAADLFFRLGEVARVGDGDADTAVRHFQQTLKHDPNHPQAIAALEKLARERRDHVLLADMLQRRVATLTTPNDRVALLVEISELERRADRPDAALAALARARNDAPDDIRVLAPLADLYFALGRVDEAAPIYDRLADEARTARRMKDVARFRQRQGGIYEARGDRAAAVTAYEEALRVNPTDVSTMTGLGRLYFAAEDWEKARRIYQSLVLQNLDPESGVTKAEVYWALGKIHLQLGQPPKAKTMFQRGLELEPANPKLREALSSLA